MTKTTDTTFKGEKNLLENRPIHLFTVHDYDGASHNLNYAEYQTAVTYDGVTYDPFPITFDGIKENNQGQIDSVSVKVGNISRLIQGYLETYDLRGKKVTIITVWASQLGDSNANIKDIFYIDSYSANEDEVNFTLTTKFDVLNVQLPQRRFLRSYCQWKFKGAECGYSGGETSCKKTKTDCKENKDNYERFGGFPSINPKRTVIT
jgi:lambda family phage minor tail protein L